MSGFFFLSADNFSVRDWERAARCRFAEPPAPLPEFIKKRPAVALLTFLIHVSGARDFPAPQTVGKSRWKINDTIFTHRSPTTFFSLPRSDCEAPPVLFISRFDRAAAGRLVCDFIFVAEFQEVFVNRFLWMFKSSILIWWNLCLKLFSCQKMFDRVVCSLKNIYSECNQRLCKKIFKGITKIIMHKNY